MTQLFLPCIIISIITYYLINNSKNKLDKQILNLIFFGQKILLISSIFKLNKLTEVTHLIYSVILIVGAIYFKEKQNILFIISTLLATLISRNYYNDCLFYLTNGHTKIINTDINFDYIIYSCLLICLYKII